ncbi:MAG: hypothetical protein HY226_06650 [Candidatus Vogelbacteria bacterium]|nr:hypothetical protein [Candidatus Vogelbacteria bacterium]
MTSTSRYAISKPDPNETKVLRKRNNLRRTSMISTSLVVGILAQQIAILTLFTISGTIAFSGIADRIAAAKLPKEPKTGKDALWQVIRIITVFVTMLSATYLAMCLGLKLRILILALCFFSTQRFTHDLLGQTGISAPARRIASVLMSVALNFGWYVYPNWITIDFIALFMGVQMLVAYRNITLKQSAILSFGIMGYDALMVFGTGLMQKVAEGAATGGKVLIPVLVMIPKTLSINSSNQFMLGLGDIVLPGFIVMCALRLAVRHRSLSLAIGAWLGYVAGSIMALTMLFIFKFPQPATIYLMPGTFLGLLLAAWWNGLVDKVFFAKEA